MSTFKEEMGEIFAPMLHKHQEELPPIPAKDLVYDAMSHLGAARTQMLPTDDELIRAHVIIAHELLKQLYRRVR